MTMIRITRIILRRLLVELVMDTVTLAVLYPKRIPADPILIFLLRMEASAHKAKRQ